MLDIIVYFVRQQAVLPKQPACLVCFQQHPLAMQLLIVGSPRALTLHAELDLGTNQEALWEMASAAKCEHYSNIGKTRGQSWTTGEIYKLFLMILADVCLQL